MTRSLCNIHIYIVVVFFLCVFVVVMAHQTSIIASRYPSVHSAGITEVHDVPVRVIIRPIPPILDEEKVASIMETLMVRNFRLAPSKKN